MDGYEDTLLCFGYSYCSVLGIIFPKLCYKLLSHIKPSNQALQHLVKIVIHKPKDLWTLYKFCS